MQNILVVGGAGYIGSHTVKLLAAKGLNVVVVDNLIYGHTEAINDIPLYVTDLKDTVGLQNVFAANRFDAVVHFAAFTYVGESVENPAKYYQNNVAGTLNLLDVMRQNGVGKIVFSSSCAVYGEPEYTPLDERHTLAPVSPYGKTKLMIEQILSDYHNAYGLKYIALRYFNAAGASASGEIGESHNPETHIIPLVLKAIKGERAAIEVFGTDYDTDDGTCIRDYIHVEDLATAHFLALGKLDTYSGCLNLGTGQGISVKQIIAAAEKVTGKTCPVKYGQRRKGDPAKLFAANDKVKQVLGFAPAYTNIEDIIRTAWAWEQNKRF